MALKTRTDTRTRSEGGSDLPITRGQRRPLRTQREIVTASMSDVARMNAMVLCVRLVLLLLCVLRETRVRFRGLDRPRILVIDFPEVLRCLQLGVDGIKLVLQLLVGLALVKQRLALSHEVRPRLANVEEMRQVAFVESIKLVPQVERELVDEGHHEEAVELHGNGLCELRPPASDDVLHQRADHGGGAVLVPRARDFLHQLQQGTPVLVLDHLATAAGQGLRVIVGLFPFVDDLLGLRVAAGARVAHAGSTALARVHGLPLLLLLGHGHRVDLHEVVRVVQACHGARAAPGVVDVPGDIPRESAEVIFAPGPPVALLREAHAPDHSLPADGVLCGLFHEVVVDLPQDAVEGLARVLVAHDSSLLLQHVLRDGIQTFHDVHNPVPKGLQQWVKARLGLLHRNDAGSPHEVDSVVHITNAGRVRNLVFGHLRRWHVPHGHGELPQRPVVLSPTV
eukprot:scaffold831_cov268-Pinguiococcus_pyrenoidosus.AAC.9